MLEMHHIYAEGNDLTLRTYHLLRFMRDAGEYPKNLPFKDSEGNAGEVSFHPDKSLVITDSEGKDHLIQKAPNFPYISEIETTELNARVVVKFLDKELEMNFEAKFPEEEEEDSEGKYDGYGAEYSQDMRLRALSFARMKLAYFFMRNTLPPSVHDEFRNSYGLEDAKEVRASMKNVLTREFFESLDKRTLYILGFTFIENETFVSFPYDVFYLLPNSFNLEASSGKAFQRKDVKMRPDDFIVLGMAPSPFGFQLKNRNEA